ncbi:beta-trefoil DNA-binding domain-containing protein [Pilobolus umbonatus]|nr:beta-trefoil DNA-binding domain-containing protein [Pilobolus umbonatus]
MESLLTAIESAHPIQLPQPKRSRPLHSMSIESILQPYKRHKLSPLSPPPSPNQHKQSTITCYHASVAQKSYGTEKRFLCPPPIVSISDTVQSPILSMSVICESGDRSLEQRTLLNDNKGTFKYLFVSGTAKAKQFCLRVNLNHSQQHQSAYPPYASFYSNPISIISKPSKKTAKARNASTCLFTHSYVSLFNRINSQTVRTKYLTTDSSQLCAKHSSWSPFEIIVVSHPNQVMNPHNHSVSVPITYGTEIILKDIETGITSPTLIVRKVDKGNIVPGAYGLLSQMQKIALELASSPNVYLNANGLSMSQQQQQQQQDNQNQHNTNAYTDFSPSVYSDDKESVNDYQCWTIVGISKFEYSFSETLPQVSYPEFSHSLTSPPPSPPRSIVPIPHEYPAHSLPCNTLIQSFTKHHIPK